MAEQQKSKPTDADRAPKDAYDGKYKDAADGMSEADLWGTTQNPVKSDPLPAKGLQKVGG